MKINCLFLACLLPACLQAQFQLNGVATQSAAACYTLTPEANTVVGSIWSPLKIDLNESFQAIFRLHLGCKDDSGADGIVFGFQPVSTQIGGAGGGLGFQYVAPSLGIEFDTWQNDQFSDPSYDHIAIIRDGDLNHADPAVNLAGPVQASPNNANIEDCAFHRVRVDWDAGQQLLRVWFDCNLRLSYTGDIVNDIFDGDPLVYWGFTAGTGAANNLQQVCLDYTSFFQAQPDVRICAGGQAQLEVSGGLSYIWTPAEGLSNPNIPNPVAAPDTTTTYIVEMRDACQFPYYDTVTVSVHPDSLLVDLGPDASFCEGTSFELDATPLNPTPTPLYFWSNGSQDAQLEVLEGGLYRVTVSLGADCITEDWIDLHRIDLPQVWLPTDTLACVEEPLRLEVQATGAETYLWSTGDATPFLETGIPGVYEVIGRNECGEARADIRVDFRPCLSGLFVANIFTPNFDGINDRVGVMGPEGIGEVLFFRIFDRWGNLVFEERNIPVSPNPGGWDGLHGNRPAAAGVYVYLAEVRFLNGAVLQIKGAVQLLR